MNQKIFINNNLIQVENYEICKREIFYYNSFYHMILVNYIIRMIP
jgi:hypothetical protein